MKLLTTVIKILVLISAAGLAVLRFISFKYEAAFSAQTLHLFFILSVVFAAVLVLAGAAWILIEKRAEKAGKSR